MKSFSGYLYEKEDYFTDSQFGNEDGDTWNVQDVIRHAKSDPEYFHKAFPVKPIENQLSYWKNSKAQRIRMKKSDTSFPILVIQHKDGTQSVSDGLNRLKKAISIEKRDTIPAYVIPEQDIEYLKIKSKYFKKFNESFADQYKAVRAAARPGDELLRTKKGWLGKPSTLQSHIDGKTPAAIIPTANGKFIEVAGNYIPSTRIANTSVGSGDFSWEDQVNTNSHELAHAAQHAAQRRDRASGKIRGRGFMRSLPQFYTAKPGQNYNRSHRRKVKKNKAIIAQGWIGAKNREQLTHQYTNSDIEIGASVMGHAARYLDHRPEADRPNTNTHMQHLAMQMGWPQYNGGSDPVRSRQGVQAAIQNLRANNVKRFRNEQARETQSTLTPRSMRMAQRQFSRILQHHEEQLPADIHTPQGRDAFIRAHGSRR